MTSAQGKKNSVEVNDKVVAPSTPIDVDDIAIGSQESLRDHRYLRASKWTVFYRSVLFQMILFGWLSLVGPAMMDAISNLGGGGLSSPWLANLANCLNYLMSFFCTLFGGPLINKFRIKWSCMIAAVSFPLYGSAYYVNARQHIDWYLLFANLIIGITTGFLYVGETTAMLSYPKADDRGFYLGIWAAMRNSGSVIGGAINFSNNYEKASAGGIAWSTYLIFVGFECTGPLWAFLLSPTPKVRRRDGSKVPSSDAITWKEELKALWEYLRESKTWLIFIPSFYSFFYGGTMGTYLSLHFSVRARALSSLLVPSIVIPSVLAFGKLLDSQWLPQRRRAWVAFTLWAIPQGACFIWIGIMYSRTQLNAGLDYEQDTVMWAKAYVPYLVIFATGYWCQLTLYWILGTFSTDVKVSSRSGGVFRAFETAGQAVSYGLSSASGIQPQIAFYVNCALFVLVLPSISYLIREVPKHSDGEANRDGYETENDG
ncbi:MFS general substrate transporter [Hortaea werneckii]|nr:MFS general substrate transporter [Hortaea werneckii]